LQGVLGRTPVEAGLAVTALVAGWPLAVIFARLLFQTFGLINVMRGGAVIMCLGSFGLVLLTPGSSTVMAAFDALVVSLGMGWAGFTAIAMTQESVEWSMRASATSANIFSRSLGSAIGTSSLGTVLNLGLTHFADPADTRQIHAMLNHNAGLAAVANSRFQDVLFQSVHLTFWGIAIFSIALAFVTLFVPANEVVFKRAPAAPR
jgi:Na+/melibiose symporter-like transporter